jgi:hypothetical protein
MSLHSATSCPEDLRGFSTDFGGFLRMSHNGSGNGSTPILRRVGLAGAAARFAQHSYAADYIALGFLVMGWILVRWDMKTD